MDLGSDGRRLDADAACSTGIEIELICLIFQIHALYKISALKFIMFMARATTLCLHKIRQED